MHHNTKTPKMNDEPINIFTISDFEELILNRTIQGDIVIRGEQITALRGVEKVIGSLGISCSTLIDLGELKEITGDFWISTYSCVSQITNLGNIEYIGGNCRLRYSNIQIIDSLKKVGGDLSLRDTPINSIGVLRYVGGNLFLPKRIQNEFDFSKIEINGKLKFWNDDKNRVVKEIERIELKLHSSEIPQWNQKYIYSLNDLSYATEIQKSFYFIYKNEFKNGNFIDLKGNSNYCFVLLYDLLNEYEQTQDLQLLHNYYENLQNYYPITQSYAKSILIEQYKKKGNYQVSWDLLNSNGNYIPIITIFEYENLLGKQLLNGKIIVTLGGTSHLTNFGRENISNIIPFVSIKLADYEAEKKKKFFDLFFLNGKMYPKKVVNTSDVLIISNKEKLPFNDRYDVDYYKQFYFSESEFEFYKKIDSQGTNLDFKPEITHVVEKAILSQFRLLIKHSEDLYRESIGMPKIGEGWISETDLFYKIKISFSNFNVIHHASPKWLGRQHLDIYMPELNIGIEYQGLQHYKPVEYFGGEEAFKKNIERDNRKKELCILNNCKLIYVSEGYDFEEVKQQINEIITVHNTQYSQ